MCMYVCVCMYVCMYVCVYVCMYFFLYYLFTACPITTVILHACLLGLFTMLFTYVTALKRCNALGAYITILGYRMEFGL